ncbi:MAG: hypothetical protein JWO77_3847, partial [Ilumatobacteraceae bacterium]|nr:hypothetical protein [Ilumatobacteraceae bacterium]
MFDQPTDPDREARRKRAHALLDRVLDVDPATAHGSELTGLMVARAELACVIDGAAVAAMAPWEASA